MTAPALAAAFAALAAAPAPAGTTCNFNVECYLTEPCAGAGWELTVDRDAGVLSSLAEELQILHVEDGEATQIVAKGAGSLNLLTIGATMSLFTVHLDGEPAAITYVGECRAQ
jgi:hypothetical protein